MLNRSTGEVKPAWCWRLSCGPCLPRAAYVRAMAIHDARPERMMTITQVGDDWQTVRSRMRHLTLAIRQQGIRHEWVWSVEPNPKGTGHHVHAWQRGQYIPQRALAIAADSVGAGRVADVRAWDAAEAEREGYGLKGAGYGVKGAGDALSASVWLAANGGRLTHQSRRWWSQEGVRHDERAALARRRPEEAGRWEIVSLEQIRWECAGGVLDAFVPTHRGRGPGGGARARVAPERSAECDVLAFDGLAG